MTESEWKRVIEEQRVSGRSVAAFCRERGLKDNSFHYWRAKFGERKFVQVSGREVIEVTLSDGTLLRVPGSQVGVVLKALRGE